MVIFKLLIEWLRRFRTRKPAMKSSDWKQMGKSERIKEKHR